jgi:hypothetical protein
VLLVNFQQPLNTLLLPVVAVEDMKVAEVLVDLELINPVIL